jgi:hypothetical protein
VAAARCARIAGRRASIWAMRAAVGVMAGFLSFAYE